jgi:hypothetical protein
MKITKVSERNAPARHGRQLNTLWSQESLLSCSMNETKPSAHYPYQGEIRTRFTRQELFEIVKAMISLPEDQAAFGGVLWPFVHRFLGLDRTPRGNTASLSIGRSQFVPTRSLATVSLQRNGLSRPCRSPKLCPALKSTACTISSTPDLL